MGVDELKDDLLVGFNRYQMVVNDWIPTQNGDYELIHRPHVEDWDNDRKRRRVERFRELLAGGGKLFGAYDSDALVGFSAIDGVLLGSAKQYLELAELHVSYEYRGQGIGKVLFGLCAQAARGYGCKKLYIVASSSEESQNVYRKLGCVYAVELIGHLHEQSPGDVHLEFVL
jgi:ribosomal protein S18 acetylase RimI-like enzyme